MARKYLGDTFDIHGGGVDLRFPHHENEQAQSRAAGLGFARYWMHNGWLTASGEKMSKSLGNGMTVSEVTRHARPLALRYYLGASHYRSTLEYGETSLTEAAAAVDRIEGFLRRVAGRLDGAAEIDPVRVVETALPAGFREAMDDDVNVAGALADSGVPLGIVPTGTANLFARNLGLRPWRLQHNVDVALGGADRVVDLGWSRHRRGDHWSDEEPFCVLAGLGNDAATVLAVEDRHKRRLRWLAYLGAGASRLSAPAFEVTVVVDDEPARRVHTWCVLAGNAGRLPAGITVFPDAHLDDGELDTLLVPLTHPRQWVGVAAKGLGATSGAVAALTYGRARRLAVLPAQPQPLQLDGDAVEAVDEASWRVGAAQLIVRVSRGRRPRPAGTP